MFCKKCGAKLPPNAKFCHECGTSIGTESNSLETYEYREEIVDLRHLKYKFRQEYREHRDAAWKTASNLVMDRIQLMAKQGWEIVDHEIGFNLLESKPAVSKTGILLDIASLILNSKTADATSVSELVCARLHFKKKSK